MQFLSYDSLLNLNHKGAPTFLAKKIYERFHILDFNHDPFYAERLLLSTHHSSLHVTQKVKNGFEKLLREKQIPKFNYFDKEHGKKIRKCISDLVVKRR